jgi:ABC-2 type transport system permease protein
MRREGVPGVATGPTLSVAPVYSDAFEHLPVTSRPRWALAVAREAAGGDVVTWDVGLTTAVVLVAVVTAGADWYAGGTLRTKLAGEE